jgi:hypothetical protein
MNVNLPKYLINNTTNFIILYKYAAQCSNQIRDRPLDVEIRNNLKLQQQHQLCGQNEISVFGVTHCKSL